jgi:predicted O-linked N-acetylglucosamine transferase (SPINDLY family)
MQNPYIDQYIYKILKLRYPTLTPDEICIKIRIIFKQLINGIRDITKTTELDTKNTPMGFLFQHLREDIVRIVANCSAPGTREILLRNNIYNLDWNIQLFKCLVELDAKDVIIWYFLQIPYYIENGKEQTDNRKIYMQMLDYFISSWPTGYTISEEEFLFASNETCMPYASAYHNQNNTELLAKYCKLIRKIAPWVNYYSPRIAETILKGKTARANENLLTTANYSAANYSTANYNTANYSAANYSAGDAGIDITVKNDKDIKSKRRICFITDSFATDSSVLRDRIGIIGKLDRARFDVYIAGFLPAGAYRGILADVFIKKYKSVYIHLESSLAGARKQLEALELDIIIYPDLGMKVLPTLLAYSRLAMIQITTWGHSETSGIDTIDYYVSSKWFESSMESAQTRYTEKLILFNSLGTFYFSPNTIFIDNNNNLKLAQDKPYRFNTKVEMGFPEGVHIYCCLQTFYKMSPAFEATLARILQLDRNGIILLSNGFPYCHSHLARLKRVIGQETLDAGRIRWIPAVDKPAFLNLVAISDVVLDPFPFGGCNTTFEAFDYNVPVITWPGECLHGRFTYGLYCKMNMADCECIVSNAEEYAQIAARVAMNEKLQHKIQRSIEANKGLIFQERASVDEWNIWLDSLS